MLECILFDLDGTLLPMDEETFVKGYFKLLAKKLAPMGFEPQELIDTVWKGTVAMRKNQGEASNEDVFWTLFAEKYGADSLEKKDVFESFYANEFNEAKAFCNPNPEVPGVIEAVKEKGYRLAIASDPLFPVSGMQARVRWAGLDPEDFEWISSYSTSNRCKPSAEFFAGIAEGLNVAPENCLVVGNDTVKDMVAEEIGMKVFLLTDDLSNDKGVDIDRFPRGSFHDLLQHLETL